MALRTIRLEGDPVLGKVCREVTEVTPKIVQQRYTAVLCPHKAVRVERRGKSSPRPMATWEVCKLYPQQRRLGL